MVMGIQSAYTGTPKLACAWWLLGLKVWKYRARHKKTPKIKNTLGVSFIYSFSS